MVYGLLGCYHYLLDQQAYCSLRDSSVASIHNTRSEQLRTYNKKRFISRINLP
jgi:hypothetical protein